MLQAEKMLQSASGGFKFFSNKEDKYQEAADLFTQAANAFRMQKSSAHPCSSLLFLDDQRNAQKWIRLTYIWGVQTAKQDKCLSGRQRYRSTT